MKYLSKNNVTVFAMFSILLLILVSFILCNPSIAHYKTRITVNTVDLEITPYQPVDTVEDISTDTIIEEEQQENLEETTSSEQNVN